MRFPRDGRARAQDPNRHRVSSGVAATPECLLATQWPIRPRARFRNVLPQRPIGGLDQTGHWKIDARFNREDLVARIRYLAEFRHRVRVTQLDARDFLRTLLAEHQRMLVYVDPPYILQGDDLYLDRLTYEDHVEISSQLTSSPLRWFMTYDCDDRITDDLYPNLRCARFNIAHTAHRQHVGSEYAVFSDNLVVPSLDILPNDDAEWVLL
jgi:DNA adenine methylase